AQRLEVALPNNTGFLIIGANIVARTIAKALQDNDFKTIITGSNWENIKIARMEGLNSYYGNAMSLHADRNLDLIGIGTLLACSPQGDYNILAGKHYSAEFGDNQVYTLLTDITDNSSRSSVQHDHHQLFNQDITFSKLASLISQGATVKHTTLSESFNYTDYQNQYGKRAIPLFAFNEKRQLAFFTRSDPVIPETGWTISALITT
ncbi:MAG TPA: sodium:proton antiporter, partial [Gammaproteobacteria bacterium]|nr:sodium:proton antiporter [Gammaproteobacteria bacterium]